MQNWLQMHCYCSQPHNTDSADLCPVVVADDFNFTFSGSLTHGRNYSNGKGTSKVHKKVIL